LQHCQLCMWSEGGIQHWSCLNKPINYENSPESGICIHYTVNIGHCSRLRTKGPSSSTSWKFSGCFYTPPYGCQNGMQRLCITLSLFSMTWSMMRMALCELQPRRWPNGTKTDTVPWSLCAGRCATNMLKLLQWPVYFSVQHISLILRGSCDRSGSGTRELIYVLRPRPPILPNTNRPFRSMWRMNTAPNIDDCLSSNPN